MAKANTTFYHPSENGSGSRLRCTLHYQTDDRPGFVRLLFANQTADGWDENGEIDCDLAFDDVSRLSRILGGDEACKEPFELKPDGTYLMVKDLKDRGFGLAAVYKDDAEEFKSQIVLKPHEAEGLRIVLEQTLFFLAFIKGVNP